MRHLGGGGPDDRRGQLREFGNGARGAADSRNRRAQGPRRSPRPAHAPAPERVDAAERTGATVLGAVLTEVLILLIPVITGADFQLPYLHWTLSTCAGAVALAVGVGLARGRVPGLGSGALSAGDCVVRGGRVGGALLRRGLVVAQFTVTAALLTMTLLIWHQLDYFQNLLRENSTLGFKAGTGCGDQRTSALTDGSSPNAFKTELLQDSRIAAVSLSETVPGGWSRGMYGVQAGGREKSK